MNDNEVYLEPFGVVLSTEMNGGNYYTYRPRNLHYFKLFVQPASLANTRIYFPSERIAFLFAITTEKTHEITYNLDLNPQKIYQSKHTLLKHKSLYYINYYSQYCT